MSILKNVTSVLVRKPVYPVCHNISILSKVSRLIDNITLRIGGGQGIGNFIDTNEKVVGFNPLSKKS